MCFYNFFTILSNLELSPPNLRVSEGIVTLIFLFNISILRQISIQHLLCTDWESAFGTACLMSQAQLQLQIMMLSIAQSCLTLCAPMDCSLSGSSVHGILQARILEWVAMPSSRGSSQHRGRDRIRISYVSCVGRWFFTTRTTWKAQVTNKLLLIVCFFRFSPT